MYKKVDKWPEVLPNDNGIRPAGKSNECFYCKQKVGQLHKQDCVTVTSVLRFNVLMNDKVVGTFEQHEPYSQDLDTIMFRLNEGSWCADNCLDDVDWNDDTIPPMIEEYIKKKGCSCSLLSFEF
jgi:hypothetical protein